MSSGFPAAPSILPKQPSILMLRLCLAGCTPVSQCLLLGVLHSEHDRRLCSAISIGATMSRIRQKSGVSSWPYGSRELVFWCAFGSLLYSSLVALIAIESVAWAEWLLTLGSLQQVAHFGIATFCVLGVVGDNLSVGWKSSHAYLAIASGCVLVSIDPNSNCCSVIVSAIAGDCPMNEVTPGDIFFHVLPMLGCTAIVLTPAIAPSNNVS